MTSILLDVDVWQNIILIFVLYNNFVNISDYSVTYENLYVYDDDNNTNNNLKSLQSTHLAYLHGCSANLRFLAVHRFFGLTIYSIFIQ
jgi:hypothetical protein